VTGRKERKVDKKRRRAKKMARREVEAMAKKLPSAFKTGDEKRDWIKDVVLNHPAVNPQYY